MKFLKYAKKQLQNRPDSEHKQAILRLVLVFGGVIYANYIFFFKGAVAWGIVLTSSSFLISLGILAHIIYKPSPNPTRRIVGCLQDNIFTTLFLFSAGIEGALYLFVYPFITVGNGFRFGVKYLAFSGTLGIACMTYLMFYNDAWSSEPVLGFGIILSNLTVTLYTGILLKKLQQTQNKLEVMANNDNLTGLPNRAYFMAKLDSTFKSNMEEKHGIVCIYFDLDGFKAVNDVHGHKTGDALLQTVATNVKGTVRSTDILARLGGDEFTLLLDSKTNLDDAVNLAGRIIKTIEGIKELQGKQIKVSCSIGIAYLPSSSEVCMLCPEELLKIADEAMYKAKKGGKGRYELTNIDPMPALAMPRAS